jgi:hypothetical protein
VQEVRQADGHLLPGVREAALSGLELYGRPCAPGEVVCLPLFAYGVVPVIHVGVLSDRRGADGQPTIVHASAVYGEVLETTARAFLGGRARTRLSVAGFPGALAPEEVVERARARLGRAYDARRYNCEHFVAECHALEFGSPQMRSLLVQRSTDPWGFGRFVPAASSWLR